MALEADPQVYRRILNTICSLGTTLLQSSTLIPKLVKAGYRTNPLWHAHPQRNKHCKVRALCRKVKCGCSVQRIRTNINNLTASKQATTRYETFCIFRETSRGRWGTVARGTAVFFDLFKTLKTLNFKVSMVI